LAAHLREYDLQRDRELQSSRWPQTFFWYLIRVERFHSNMRYTCFPWSALTRLLGPGDPHVVEKMKYTEGQDGVNIKASRLVLLHLGLSFKARHNLLIASSFRKFSFGSLTRRARYTPAEA
jgi:hypothetical protein